MDPLPAWIAAAAATGSVTYLSLINGALRYYSLAKFERILTGDTRRLQQVRELLDDEQDLVIGVTALRGVALIAGSVALTGALVAHTAGTDASGLDWLFCAGWSLALGTLLFVAFGMTIPHAIGERRAEQVIIRCLPSIRIVRLLAYPAVWIFGALHRLTLRVANVAETDERAEIKAEILSAALAGQSEGVIDEHTKDVIENLIDFRDVAVTEVMTPRMDIVALDAKEDLEGMLRKAREHEFSRLPVIDGTLDKIVGILVVKDLLRSLDLGSPGDPPDPNAAPGRRTARIGRPDLDTRALLRQPIFVPETKKISDLLKELRTKKVHMAIVADEYGGTVGLVTIEDLIEEIIGEIDDEHDHRDPLSQQTPPLKRISESELDVDARLSIVDLNERAGMRVPEDGRVDTLGGLLAMRLGRIPTKGDKVTLNGYAFTVTDADDRRARRVHVKVGAK